GLGALALMPQPHVVKTCTVTIPKLRWLAPTLQLFDGTSNQWQEVIANPIFMPRQTVRVSVKVNIPGYSYCLYKGTSGDISLIFPSTTSKDDKGNDVVIDKNTWDKRNQLMQIDTT